MAEEEVRVRLGALAPLSFGNERVTLVFTPSRLIVARLAKVSSRMFLGSVGRRLVDAIKGGRQTKKRRVAESSDPLQLLAADPENFAILYRDIVSMQLETVGSMSGSELRVVTAQEKLVFDLVAPRPPEGFEDEMNRVLGERFSVQATPYPSERRLKEFERRR